MEKQSIFSRFAEAVAPKAVMNYRTSRAELEKSRRRTSTTALVAEMDREEKVRLARYAKMVSDTRKRVRDSVNTLARVENGAYSSRGYDVARMPSSGGYGSFSNASATNEIMAAMGPARAVIREIMRNEAFGAKSLELYVNNRCGKGIQPRYNIARMAQQLLMSGRDVTMDDIRAMYETFQGVMSLLYSWIENPAQFDAEGELDLYGQQRLSYTNKGEVGEFLLVGEPMTTKEAIRQGAVIPMRVRQIEPDFLDCVRTKAPNGDPVRGGRQFDKSSGRIKGYWIHPQDPTSLTPGMAESTFVDEKWVIFSFRKKRAGQIRGISPFVTVAPTFFDRNDMVKATLQSATARAAVMAIFGVGDGDTAEDSDVGENMAYTNGVVGEAYAETKTASTKGDFMPGDLDEMGVPVDSGGSPVRHVESGAILRVRKGTEVRMFDPAPAGGIADFDRIALRTIAAGPQVNAAQLSDDYVGLNYSLARVQQAPIDIANEVEQDEDISRAWSKIWTWFVQGSWAMNAEGLPGYFGPDVLRISDGTFTKPPKQDFDEERTANAQGMRTGLGTETLTQAIAQRGGDILEQFMEIAFENALGKAVGIDMNDFRFAIVKNGAKVIGDSSGTSAVAPPQGSN